MTSSIRLLFILLSSVSPLLISLHHLCISVVSPLILYLNNSVVIKMFSVHNDNDIRIYSRQLKLRCPAWHPISSLHYSFSPSSPSLHLKLSHITGLLCGRKNLGLLRWIGKSVILMRSTVFLLAHVYSSCTWSRSSFKGMHKKRSCQFGNEF